MSAGESNAAVVGTLKDMMPEWIEAKLEAEELHQPVQEARQAYNEARQRANRIAQAMRAVAAEAGKADSPRTVVDDGLDYFGKLYVEGRQVRYL